MPFSVGVVCSIGIIAVVLASGLSLPMALVPSAKAVSSPVAMSDSVQIKLRGRVTPRCGLAGMADTFALDGGSAVNRQDRVSVGFTINCNTPFIYSVRSSGAGAMKLARASASDGRAVPAIPYRIQIKIPTDDGDLLQAECDGDRLRAGSGLNGCILDSSDAVAIGQRGEVAVIMLKSKWFQSGDYEENLQITLSVKQ
ncbi:MAG: hypothetical protein KTR19_04715 [Hyphomicrobiales bacterium]|nr:hypothetical protein [Hyphomicrobiales bacterium]